MVTNTGSEKLLRIMRRMSWMMKSSLTKHFSKFPNLRTSTHKKISKSAFYEVFHTQETWSVQFTNHSTLSAETYSVCLETNTNNFLRTYGNLVVYTHISAAFRRKLQNFTQFPLKITHNYERICIYTNNLAWRVRNFQVRIIYVDMYIFIAIALDETSILVYVISRCKRFASHVI